MFLSGKNVSRLKIRSSVPNHARGHLNQYEMYTLIHRYIGQQNTYVTKRIRRKAYRKSVLCLRRYSPNLITLANTTADTSQNATVLLKLLLVADGPRRVAGDAVTSLQVISSE